MHVESPWITNALILPPKFIVTKLNVSIVLDRDALAKSSAMHRQPYRIR